MVVLMTFMEFLFNNELTVCVFEESKLRIEIDLRIVSRIFNQWNAITEGNVQAKRRNVKRAQMKVLGSFLKEVKVSENECVVHEFVNFINLMIFGKTL